MTGVLYGVGVGPGNPELMTVSAVRILTECDRIAVPAADRESCTAYGIAKQVVPCLDEKPVVPVAIPMTMDEAVLAQAYKSAVGVLFKYMQAGEKIAFINLGDPTLYGTYMRVHALVVAMGGNAQIVSGVSSVCAVAARLDIPLVSENERLHIVPGCYETDGAWMERQIKNGDTLVIMKSGNSKQLIGCLAKLEHAGIAKTYAAVNCGMPDEAVFDDLTEYGKYAGENSRYFTTLIVKPSKRTDENKDIYVYKHQNKLRCGVTTGTCAAVAAAAAARWLLLGDMPDRVTVLTPKNIRVELPVVCEYADGDSTICKVQKDSGDDPDVTDGIWIYARVERIREKVRDAGHLFTSDGYPKLYLDGGEGIGRVTATGMEQEVGQAAINATPRAMIFRAVGEVCETAECRTPLLITVSIPEGKMLAEKTMNPTLGIQGGLSVLGTSGILEPMSEQAIVDTISLELQIRRNRGERAVLCVPGNYGERYVENILGLDSAQCVKCSNYVGETLDLIASHGFQTVLLVGNLGKFVKLAAGIMNTHSKAADGRMEILALHTVLAGGTKEMAGQIMACVNTEQVLELLDGWQLREAVIARVCDKIEEYIRRRLGGGITFGVILFSESRGLIGETQGSSSLLALFSKGRNTK